MREREKHARARREYFGRVQSRVDPLRKEEASCLLEGCLSSAHPALRVFGLTGVTPKFPLVKQ